MLEVTADDSTFLRRDNFPAITTIDSARLVAAGTALMRRACRPWRSRWRLPRALRRVPADPPNDPLYDASPLPNAHQRAVGPGEPARSTAASRSTAPGRSPPARAW